MKAEGGKAQGGNFPPSPFSFPLISRSELSRSITEIEMLSEKGRQILADMPHVEPRIIGWTGSPGSGKSSLISRVIGFRRAAMPSKKIAVIAIDPSSVYTGGSVLGDRIRMDDHTLDQNVYIRSLASRGLHGGLAPAAMRVARFMSACGFDEIHIETVGAGQDDVEVRDYAETVLLVSSPHTGDAIQGIKAGILEIADLYVVNKCELPGAEATAGALECAITPRRADWTPEAMLVSAKDGIGIENLSKKIDDHFDSLIHSGDREDFCSLRCSAEFRDLLIAELTAKVYAGRLFSEMQAAVEKREIAPLDAVMRVLEGYPC